MAGAGVKQLNSRIRSVKNTQQITRAMKMVAAAKLRRAQDRMMRARPFAHKTLQVLQSLAARFEVSAERIRQLEANAMNKIRASFSA